MASHRILVIAYLFPPAGGVGVHRVLSYVKYLPRHNCNVSVITTHGATAPVLDPGLLAQVPADTRIYRTFTPEPSYALRDRFWKWLSAGRRPASIPQPKPRSRQDLAARLKNSASEILQRALCPDPQVLWNPFALRRARTLVCRENIDTVLVTAPPFSSLAIATRLKTEFPRLKLICDLRDEWLDHFLGMDSAFSDYKRQLAERLEHDAVQAADHVIIVTPPWLEALRLRYPDQPASKFLYIPNGYDPAVFDGFRREPKRGGRLIITYLGSVYNNPVYSPKTYLDAIDSLPASVRDDIETCFVGRIAIEALPLFEGRHGHLRQVGFLPQQQAIAYLEQSDYLLLMIGTTAPHSGKLFEYLATGRPVLGLCPPGGEVARILKETGGGLSAHISDPSAIASLLLLIHQHWKAGQPAPVTPDREAIRAYARPQLVAEFARATGLSP